MLQIALPLVSEIFVFTLHDYTAKSVYFLNNDKGYQCQVPFLSLSSFLPASKSRIEMSTEEAVRRSG